MSQKKQEVKFDCQGCGRLVTGREYHPHLYCKLHKLGLLDQVMQLIKDRDAERETQLLDALYRMYGQYCGHDKWGHKFMGAGETASALLEDAGYIVVDTVGMITKDYGDSREQQLEAIIREDTVLGMPIKTDPKLKSNQIRFDHPDGRSEGFEL